jgi:hypothetical protein
MTSWYKPVTVGQGTIQDRKGNYYLIRNEAFNSRTTPTISWQVVEIMSNYDLRLDREFNTKRDAKEWLYGLCLNNEVTV